MRIFAAGLITETNTLSPIPTALEDFRVQHGKDLALGPAKYPDLDLSGMWGQQARARGDELIVSLMAWAQPSGITIRSAYESLRDEILGDLQKALPIDIVLLNLHGAMIAVGYEDCEQDLIERVRSLVGQPAVIGAEFDPHCHLHSRKIAAADLVILYKEYPHTDINQRATELFELAVAVKLQAVRPTSAIFDCQMVGMYPTSRQPLRGFVDSMKHLEKTPGILSISFAHGFQHADVPSMGAKVLVITNNDKERAEALAREVGLAVYAMRRQIGFESLSVPLDQALSQALRSENTPVVIADQSDNPGGGAPGDATFALRWLLERGVDGAAVGIFYDPQVVEIARKAGLQASLSVRLGGKLGTASGLPLDLDVTVLSTRTDYMHEFPQQSGPPSLRRAGDVVSLRCGGIDIVVSTERCQCLSPSIFSDLGVDLAKKRLILVKSAQHFYSAFFPLAGEIIYMSGPGAVPPDPRLIAYRRVNSARLYPWVEDPIFRK